MVTTGKLDLLQDIDVAFITVGRCLHENSFISVSITKNLMDEAYLPWQPLGSCTFCKLLMLHSLLLADICIKNNLLVYIIIVIIRVSIPKII